MKYVPVTDNPIDATTPLPTLGPTNARPPLPTLGQTYYDTTLERPLWWDGEGWAAATGDPA
jgi:hypothetical protein